MKEFCGIFGVFGEENAREIVYLGLYALQHRGQESAGIVASNEKKLTRVCGMGLVNDVFTKENLRKLKGSIAIGHVRYSTYGSTKELNIQPLLMKFKNTEIAIAHNGNIPNAKYLRRKLEEEGVVFATETDSEIILKMIARQKTINEETILNSLNKIKRAFSLLILLKDKLIAVRDSYGYRPLCIGKRKNSILFSSESCAFDIVEAEYLRDVKPGEMVVVDKNGMKSYFLEKKMERRCIFELIYFSRPDSTVFSQSVYETRINMGKNLAKEYKIDADLVMPVPDSANVQALGYSIESGIPLEFGLIRNHYVGRTFIEPHQKIRDFRVKIKHTPVKEVLKGKRVIVIDDSIVRGTTSRKLMNIIRSAGAKEIHLLISSPPIKFGCFFGIDTPKKKELIANKMKIEEIKRYIGVDSLHYLSLDGLLKSCKKLSYCVGCFTGKYEK